MILREKGIKFYYATILVRKKIQNQFGGNLTGFRFWWRGTRSKNW